MSYPKPSSERPVGAPPHFDVVTVRGYTDRGGEERAAYTRIGAAWSREKGGVIVRLNALPMNETIYLFERKEEAEA